MPLTAGKHKSLCIVLWCYTVIKRVLYSPYARVVLLGKLSKVVHIRVRRKAAVLETISFV